MPPLQRAILKIGPVDVDGDGNDETGEFHMVGDLEVTPGLRTGYLVGGRGSTILSVIANLSGLGESKRRQFFIEAGGGARTTEVSFRGWEGAIDGNDDPVQWGDSDTVERTKTNATGQDPITQIDVLMRYLEIAEIDSRNPAVLEYGEFSSKGLYEPMDVVVEGPNMTRAAQDGSWYTGSVMMISAADINELWDAALQLKG